MTVLSVLTQARDLISSDGKFNIGCYARNDKGHEVDPQDKTAVTFCALGALYKQETGKNYGDIIDAEDVLRSVAGDKKIRNINDQEGLPAVINLYNLAIENVSKEEIEEDVEDDPEILARFKEPAKVEEKKEITAQHVSPEYMEYLRNFWKSLEPRDTAKTPRD